MGSRISITSNDTLSINARPLTDFADADCAALTFPNEIATMKTGKNGNTIYSQNQTGKNCELVLRLLRGSPDDKFLNSLRISQSSDFAGMIPLIGEFIKRVGDGSGNMTSDIYLMTGGVFSKNPEAKTNAEGDTEQSIVIYTIKFANSDRAIA